MSKPLRVLQSGQVELNIWSNESKAEPGTHYLTFQLHRRYQQQGGGDWQTTPVLRKEDLPHAVLVLNKAFEIMNLKDGGGEE